VQKTTASWGPVRKFGAGDDDWLNAMEANGSLSRVPAIRRGGKIPPAYAGGMWVEKHACAWSVFTTRWTSRRVFHFVSNKTSVSPDLPDPSGATARGKNGTLHRHQHDLYPCGTDIGSCRGLDHPLSRRSGPNYEATKAVTKSRPDVPPGTCEVGTL
jgi:hypothetical protein